MPQTPSVPEKNKIEKLRRQRGNIQRAITMFEKVLDQWKDQANDERDSDYLQVSLESLQETFLKFHDIQDAIEEIDGNEADHNETLRTSYIRAIARARKYLRECNGNQNQTNQIQSFQPSHKVQTIPTKLPTISLPTFDGSIEEWSSFQDIFSSLIDNNDELSAVQKLQYLRLSLKGNAANSIQELETSHENYEVALSILKKKYECNRRILRRHWAILREYSKPTRDTSETLTQLIDTFQQHLRALEKLKAPVKNWDIPIIDLILTKINPTTAWHWELTLTDKEMPSYNHLLSFLEKRATCGEFSAPTAHNKSNHPIKNTFQLQRSHPSQAQTFTTRLPVHNVRPQDNYKCFICKGSHSIYKCDQFLSMSPDERQQAVTKASLCYNCLSRGHNAQSCKSSCCRKCGRKHHTYLHSNRQAEIEQSSVDDVQADVATKFNQNNGESISKTSGRGAPSHAFVVNTITNDLMVTAAVNILDNKKQPVQTRCLIDTGSTANFISEDFATRLGIRVEQCQIPIGALNSLQTISKGFVTTTIESRINNFKQTLNFLIIPKISDRIPDQQINRETIPIPKNIQLADPEFHRPAPVNVLIGAGTALSILSIGQIDLSPENGPALFLQKTRLGWVIGGSTPSTKQSSLQQCQLSSNLDIDLSKFWEIEEGCKIQYFTPDEKICEEHFERNVSRNSEGRYSVALPFNSKRSQLGQSKSMAFNRLQGLERRFARDSNFKHEYGKIIQEYLDLGHMTRVASDEEDETGFYLPHHAVFKKSSLTTAVRVVFDASAKSSTGVSLNDILHIGPTIQSELFSLLIRFRQYPIVLTGDIAKMYRQFLIRKEDRKYQRILWRDSTGQVATYELNTVTFGVAPAPYLAIRCLHKLAEDEFQNFPLASEVIKKDFYVDDALTGAQTIDDAIEIRNQLTSLLQRGGLTIRQWASNRHDVLQDLPDESINKQLLLGDPTLKTLGIRWDSVKDVISYVVQPMTVATVSKRTILSEIARIFDPLGLLAPIIITAKILMQKIWSSKLDWDESLPASLHTEWMNYHQELQLLNEISFDRYVLLNNNEKIELHGFCDASERAYGACIYIRSSSADGTCQTILLCAKSRVAPIKATTIPRLELCGALLLTQLMESVKESLKLDIFRIRYWTDSTIVLHWLKTSSNTLKTFVANRVSEIQSKTDTEDWLHVRTYDNPADLISRGQKPTEFTKSSIWRFGPPWLQENETEWPQQFRFAPPIDEVLEKRQIQCFNLQTFEINLLEKYSTIRKLQGVVAYCLRFKINNKNKGPLTAEELTEAMQCIIKMVQKVSFKEEIQRLSSTDGTLNSKSHLLPLNPFIDRLGILRVGGRLQNAKLSFTEKHPAILPKSHHITNLLINWEHRRHLHAGVHATLYALRKSYWICDGRRQIRRVIRSCVTCCRLKPPTTNYIMGQLPSARVNQSRPFSRVGVDYCGPFLIKEKKHRNRNTIKTFVAVFVCFATKAVHLELVSDLSTEAFLGAFRRFISRRGLCNEIYSDNGTNFVGANNEIKELNSFLRNDQFQQQIISTASNQQIAWHFIPARSPHFGGLWEAAVKSFKHHLRRVVGAQLFTYEEFNTFITEIEAVLNSRPLFPVSSDPNDYTALTPGHFIIGDSLTSLPEKDLCKEPINKLTRWKHIQQLKQHFWNRWSKEYINELTIRHKWSRGNPSPTEGSIVVLKEDNLPPLQWAIGRILRIHPGPDGIVRVVTVKTSRGIYDRSVHKIGLLPIQPVE